MCQPTSFEISPLKIEYINKSIDETILVELKSQGEKIENIKSSLSGIEADIENLKEDVDGNPLAN